MTKMLRLAFALVLLVTSFGAVAAEIKPFAREDLASDAVRLAEDLRKETIKIGAKLKGRSPDQLLKNAAAFVTASDFKAAAEQIGAAIAAAPKDAAPWLAYAHLGQAADDAKAEGRNHRRLRGL